MIDTDTIWNIVLRFNDSLHTYLNEPLTESTLISLNECLKAYIREMHYVGVLNNVPDYSKIGHIINPKDPENLDLTEYTKSLLDEIEIYFDQKM